jgi:hypothetical protein
MSTRALVAVSLFAAASLAFAGTSGSPKGVSVKAQSNAVAGAGEKASGFLDINGNGDSTALPQYSFTTVAEGSVSCKKSCSLLLEASAQIATGGADWALCLVVDGADYECQYQGIQSGPSGFVFGNARAFAAQLASGAHDVQIQLYSESATASYQFYQLDTTTYTP